MDAEGFISEGDIWARSRKVQSLHLYLIRRLRHMFGVMYAVDVYVCGWIGGCVVDGTRCGNDGVGVYSHVMVYEERC